MSDNIGQGVDRVDGRAKVTGTARFAAEFNEKNLAYAVAAPATIAYGTIKSIDTTAASKVPGVVLIFTHLNLPKLNPIDTFARGGAAGENKLPLSGPEIFHAGQHIALVVANTFEQVGVTVLHFFRSKTHSLLSSPHCLIDDRGDAVSIVCSLLLTRRRRSPCRFLRR